MRSFHAFVDLVLPSRCAGCAAPGGAWCPDCARTLNGPLPVERAGLPPAYALGAYRDAARRVVLAYKERGRRELAARFGQALAAAVPAVIPTAIPPAALSSTSHVNPTTVPTGIPAPIPAGRPPPVLVGRLPPDLAEAEARAGPLVLVPAPSRPAAARRRGGQHMAAVAEHCAAALRAAGVAATVARALRLDGRAMDSVGLDAAHRAANLAGRLRPVPARAPPPGAQVLLLDDVITTGATAAACVSALASAGAAVTAILAITAAG